MAVKPHSAILEAVEQYYSAQFAAHGSCARGVDWNSEASQELRFAQLLRLVERRDRPVSVNDLGCGYGAFAHFLDRQGVNVTYVGYELSGSMLESARSAFSNQPYVSFHQGSHMSTAEYSVASGLFNVRLTFSDSDWSDYVDDTLDAMARASTRGFAFNMLSTYSDVDRRRGDLYYADPGATFHRCKERYSPYVALLHDYPLWEFTVIVRLT